MSRKRSKLMVAAASFGVACGGLPGCVGYSSYPDLESIAPSSPNFIQVKPTVTAALKEVIRRYHPDWAGPFAVNLPVEMTAERQQQIIAELGADARPMTPETEHLPTYHIARVWVRGPNARVDVVRPVLELGPKADGGIAYQGMTVWLDAGLNPWRVDFIQPWAASVVSPPDSNFVNRPGGGEGVGQQAPLPSDTPDEAVEDGSEN